MIIEALLVYAGLRNLHIRTGNTESVFIVSVVNTVSCEQYLKKNIQKVVRIA